MTKNIILSFLSIWIVSMLNAQHTTYYVDQQNGSNSNNGTSVSTAFSNFDTAKNLVQAGDSIVIIGTYHNPSYNPNYTYNSPADGHLWHKENTIKINNLNGSAGNYITIKAHDSNTKLLGDGANIIRVTNSSYLRFEGFDMEGEVERIPLSTANALQFVYIINDNNLIGTPTNPNIDDIRYRNEDEISDGDGIIEETDVFTDISNFDVIRPSYIDTRGFYASNCEHLIITGNTIHHTPGGGLRISDSKYVEIYENEIHNCSRRSYSGTHALVVTKTRPIGSNDYSIEIERNLVHHNYNEQYSWSPSKTIITPRIDEGKGISLQRNNKNNWINGQGRILVANNICYWNGFSGVHSNDGYRIDFFHNTCFMNSYTNTITYANQTQQGKNIGISTQRGHYIRIFNNISVVDAGWGGYALSDSNSSNIEVRKNLVYGVNGTLAHDTDINNIGEIEQDPLFVDAPTSYHDETYPFDFSLQSGSPAIDAGNTSNFLPATDYFNNQRDNNPDLGAIEFSSVSLNENNKDEVSIYPNPATDIIFIKGLNEAKEYNIYDLTGKLVKKAQVYNHSMNIKDLSDGIYLINIEQQYYKVIKE